MMVMMIIIITQQQQQQQQHWDLRLLIQLLSILKERNSYCN